MTDLPSPERFIDDIFKTTNGSNAHACYCPRSEDGGCKCAIKDEYVTESKQALLQYLDDYVAAVIGENSFVPKYESWVDGAMDKPQSYKNNYEVVRYAELQNELRKEQRNRYQQLRGGENE